MNFWERTENKEHGRWNWELRFHLPSSPAAWSARSGQGAEHLSLISNLWNKPLRENPAGKREPCRVSQEGVLGNCTHHRQVSHLLMGFSWFSPRLFQSMMGKRSDNTTSCNKTAADPGSAHLDQPPAEAGTPEQVVQEHIQVGWDTFREGDLTAL